ncbi:hypothetical protein HOF65_07615 [bacterium]|nr:hypothetical protein [bacterium]MBT3853771.1 hypothetical protein [bacterium]MBT4632942.1 hypothetical protein [bacterium]MBT6778970.1 hypothetical protein [bacterium]
MFHHIFLVVFKAHHVNIVHVFNQLKTSHHVAHKANILTTSQNLSSGSIALF